VPRLHLIARGQVQGVFFRVSAAHEAQRLGLTGWVRNRPDGGVEMCAEGPADRLASYRRWYAQGPPGAIVSDLEELAEPATGEFASFRVVG
jgi:acylphosphatase